MVLPPVRGAARAAASRSRGAPLASGSAKPSDAEAAAALFKALMSNASAAYSSVRRAQGYSFVDGTSDDAFDDLPLYRTHTVATKVRAALTRGQLGAHPTRHALTPCLAAPAWCAALSSDVPRLQLHVLCIRSRAAAETVARASLAMPRDRQQRLFSLLDTLDDYELSDYLQLVVRHAGPLGASMGGRKPKPKRRRKRALQEGSGRREELGHTREQRLAERRKTAFGGSVAAARVRRLGHEGEEGAAGDAGGKEGSTKPTGLRRQGTLRRTTSKGFSSSHSRRRGEADHAEGARNRAKATESLLFMHPPDWQIPTELLEELEAAALAAGPGPPGSPEAKAQQGGQGGADEARSRSPELPQWRVEQLAREREEAKEHPPSRIMSPELRNFVVSQAGRGKKRLIGLGAQNAAAFAAHVHGSGAGAPRAMSEPEMVALYQLVCSEAGTTLSTIVESQLTRPRVDLSRARLGAKDVECFVEMMCSMPRLTSLDLSNNPLTNVAPALFTTLAENEAPPVSELSLRSCVLRLRGQKGLKRILHSYMVPPAAPCALTRLDVGDNSLSDECLAELADAMQGNSSIRTVLAPNNRAAERAAKAFACVLADDSTKLAHLDLSSNYFRSADTRALARGLEENTTLEWLDLSLNQVTSNGAAAIAEVLRRHPTLRLVELARCAVDGKGARMLCHCLAEGPNGQADVPAFLNLRENGISLDDVAWIDKELARIKTAPWVNLMGCDFLRVVTPLEGVRRGAELRVNNAEFERRREIMVHTKSNDAGRLHLLKQMTAHGFHSSEEAVTLLAGFPKSSQELYEALTFMLTRVEHGAGRLLIDLTVDEYRRVTEQPTYESRVIKGRGGTAIGISASS